MKRLRLAILLVLIPLCCVAFAALSKTTSIVVLDAWQSLDATVTKVGAAGDISDSYSTILYLEIAYTDLDAQDGVDVHVEVSYGDDDWTLLTKPFTTPGYTPNDTVLDGAVTAGDTTIDVISVSGYSVGAKIFIHDAEDGLSESVRIRGISGNIITLAHDLLRNHDTASPVYDFVAEYIIPIPAGFAYMRVVLVNSDSNSDAMFTTRISKVTSL